MPIHVVLVTQLAPERLRVAPPSVRLASVTLRSSKTYGNEPAQPPAGLVSALAGWAPTLTALRGLSLVELLDGPAPGLADFTHLRTLALLQTRDDLDTELDWVLPRPLPAALLPASLEELTLTYGEPPDGNHGDMRLPSRLAGFEALPCLRTIVFAGYDAWPLGRWATESGGDSDQDGDEDCDNVAKAAARVQLPESLEVRSAA